MTSRLDALAARAAAAYRRLAVAAVPADGDPLASLEAASAAVDAALADLPAALDPYLREWELHRLGDRAPHAVARRALLTEAERAREAHDRLLASVLAAREVLRGRIAELDRMTQGAVGYAAADDAPDAPMG